MSKYRKCYSNEALVRKIPKGILKYSCRNALIKNYQSFFFFLFYDMLVKSVNRENLMRHNINDVVMLQVYYIDEKDNRK